MIPARNRIKRLEITVYDMMMEETSKTSKLFADRVKVILSDDERKLLIESLSQNRERNLDFVPKPILDKIKLDPIANNYFERMKVHLKNTKLMPHR